MKNIMARANREVLEQFVWSNVLLAFDYDGTLAPIVENPEQARMRSQTRELLAELTKLYPIIVISGRAQPDVAEKLDGVDVLEIVGNHGIEPWHRAGRHSAEVQRWRPVLHQALAHLKGVTVEDKIYSIAVHYRHCREKRKARTAIMRAAANLGAVRVIGGKQVMNLLPKGAPHKGMALERERARLKRDTAIYVGDDETDEDVFALDQPGRLLGIRVGSKRTSAATYCVPNQRSIDDLLRALLVLRREAEQHRMAAR